MIDTKVIEIRDRGTFIPAIAVRVSAGLEPDDYLLRRAGWGCDGHPGVYLFGLHGEGPARYDPYGWGERTMHVSHLYMCKHWDDVASGDVVDVEYILGETAQPKQSEAAATPF